MDTPKIDPRAGFTSASNAAPDALCRGRHLAQRGLANIESRDARTGTLLHQAFSGSKEVLAKLSKQERKTVKRAREIETFYVSKFLCDTNPKGTFAPELVQAYAHRSVRLWAHFNDRPVHSGELDSYWISADFEHAFIEDWKGLYGEHQDADVNEQIRDYSALLWENFPGLKTVTCMINQPMVHWKFEDVMVVKYERADLERAHKEMIARVLASNDITSKRTPGPQQCRFCRAAGTSRCPESQRVMAGFHEAVIQDGTPMERGQMIGWLKAIEKIAKEKLAIAKQTLAVEPTWANGWTIGKGRKVRSLEDVIAVGSILSDLYPEKFTADQLTKICRLSVPELEELHATLNGAEDREQFSNLFGHLIEEKETEGSLVKIK